MQKLKHGSLFSGIGGFDLAAQRTGWENVFHCEWNPFGRKVLNYYWPKSEIYEDITKADFRKYRGQIDVLTGGFPCQPFSVAGSRGGSEDDRYLWPEMLRAIKEIRPTWIVGENVTGIVTMVQSGEITSVESQASLFEEDNSLLEYEQEHVIETICKDLESIGYTVQSIVIPACAVGAPHRRDRVWFIANRNSIARESKIDGRKEYRQERESIWDNNNANGKQRTTSNTYGRSEESSRKGCEIKSNWSENNDESKSRRREAEQYYGSYDVLRSNPDTSNSRIESMQQEGSVTTNKSKSIANSECFGQSKQGESGRQVCPEQIKEGKASWTYYDDRWPSQHPICNGNDGISAKLDGITFSKWRQESITGGGNAIVPQVAEEIFRFINEVSGMI